MVYYHGYGIVKQKLTLAGLLVIAGLFAFLATLAVFTNANAASSQNVIYSAVPSTLPPSMPSLGYQATSTAEFGDHIAFATMNNKLESVTVTMVNWAKHDTYPSMDASGYNHPITLNIYSVNNGELGSLVKSVTKDVFVPWRPATDPSCGGDQWKSSVTGLCYSGYAFNTTFDVKGTTVTDELIFGISYNTETHGYQPIGVGGPYNSLNVGLNTDGLAPYIGTDVDTDVVYWNTSYGPFYSDNGAGGTGTFRQDTGWSGYTVAVKFNVGPSNSDNCKKGGWESFGFKNQGSCIQYVNTGKDSR